MMDLEEAIQHCKDVAEGCPAGDRDCAYQHDHLVEWLEELRAYKALGLTVERMAELALAEKAGRLIVLPCKDDLVWTIGEDYFNCKQCPHKDKAHYDPEMRVTHCEMDVHCPLYIKQHKVGGFEICFDKAGNAVLSKPGEFGYEGLETFYGIDGKVYFDQDAAEAALEQQSGHQEDPQQGGENVDTEGNDP